MNRTALSGFNLGVGLLLATGAAHADPLVVQTPELEYYTVPSDMTYDFVYVAYGDNTTGYLTIDDGHAVSSDEHFVVGGGPGAYGSVTVTGPGSSLTAIPGGYDGWSFVGYNGEAALNVLDGGTVTLNRLWMTMEETGTSSVVVDGENSKLTTIGDMLVGYHGNANVDIRAGGALETHGVSVGGFEYMDDSVASGTLTVTGEGTSWVNTRGVFVGLGGPDSSGKLEISGGASAELTDVGLFVGTQGTAEFTGENTRVTIGNPDDDNTVDWLATNAASFTVSDGAYLYSDGGYIGNQGTELAVMTITGEETIWDTSVRIFVGGGGNDPTNDGNGKVIISDGATVTTATVSLGEDGNSKGLMILTGEGSSISTKENLNLPVPAAGNFYIGPSGVGTLIVTDGASVHADNEIRIAWWEGSKGTMNIGAEAGESAAAAGTVSGDAVHFGQGDGVVVFNHTETDYDFDTIFSGYGAVRLLAGDTTFSADSTDFTGTVDVEGDTLTLDADFSNGDFTVKNAATLAGAGSVHDLTVETGGTMTPGSSAGTLYVTGDFVSQTGSTYVAELEDGGISDLISVTGTATLAGDLEVTLPAVYAYGDSWTVLEAATIDGAFEFDEQTLSLFKQVAVNYNDGDTLDTVTVDIEKAISFASVAETPNQRATAEALDSLAGANDLLVALADLETEEDARAAYDLVSGEFNATVLGQMYETSGLMRDILIDRIRSTLSVSSGAPALPLAYADDVAPADPTEALVASPLPFDSGIWGSAFGGWARNDADGNAGETIRELGGFVVGYDAPALDDTTLLGFALGYGYSSIETDARYSSARTNDFHVGAYGGRKLDGVATRFGATLSLGSADIERSVAIGNYSETLTGNQTRLAGQAFGEIGYEASLGASTLEPFANAAYVHVRGYGYTENGGAAALDVETSDNGVGFTTLGLRASRDLPAAEASVSISGAVGWRHAFGDVAPDVTQSFSGGDAFTVSGTPIADDAVVAEFGLNVGLSAGMSLGFSYEGQFAGDVIDQAAKAHFSWSFN
ncbi:autotransporter domain-containing protein [Oricola sp.]|uniref:autotransporter family protein n=1 Tax=Oricola sp. TaxID=1979950 RepID=UPI0025F1FEFB|nr:autotransporter domain-containing protein [Oricola sp.]MCI5076892.1 autotransporter domain-containing protein [Oricola sp.]